MALGLNNPNSLHLKAVTNVIIAGNRMKKFARKSFYGDSGEVVGETNVAGK